jgi:hypothetical protein
MTYCAKTLALIVAFLIFWFAGFVVAKILAWSADLKSAPGGVSPQLWWALQAETERFDRAGFVLGLIERILAFFVALSGSAAYILLAGYLTFKLGSKWPVWSGVFRYPTSLEKYQINDLEYMRATRIWGGLALMRFIIGTTLNVLVGFAVGEVFREQFFVRLVGL